MSQTNIKVTFGAMTFGPKGTESGQVHTLEEQATMLDIFQKHGHQEIDTARLYTAGNSESMLAQNKWQDRGLAMSTKLYPTKALPEGLQKAMRLPLYSHAPAELRSGFQESLQALGAEKIDIFYLHGPDHTTPFEDTLKEVNALYEEGHFTRFGVSNFRAWEVAQICEICNRNNLVRPSVYQGVYNIFSRRIEEELMSCLRAYNISFYAYAPLAGGLMTGKYSRTQTDFEPGSRFDPNTFTAITHRPRYWNDLYFDGIEEIQAEAVQHDLTLTEVALRWISWHSGLRKERNDAIVVGASSVKHLEQNLDDLEKGPLPKPVLEAADRAYSKIRGIAPTYFH